MKNIVEYSLKIAFVCFLIFTITFSTQAQKQLSSTDFKSPPSGVKVHTWWHWLDGNITKEGITKDLEAMHEQVNRSRNHTECWLVWRKGLWRQEGEFQYPGVV